MYFIAVYEILDYRFIIPLILDTLIERVGDDISESKIRENRQNLFIAIENVLPLGVPETNFNELSITETSQDIFLDWIEYIDFIEMKVCIL